MGSKEVHVIVLLCKQGALDFNQERLMFHIRRD